MPKAKTWFTRHSPEIGEAYLHFYEAVKTKGVLDRKTKELLMLALACVMRCPHCTESHISRALEAGATKAEVVEALLIAAAEGAGTQIAWLKEVYMKHLGDDEAEGDAQ